MNHYGGRSEILVSMIYTLFVCNSIEKCGDKDSRAVMENHKTDHNSESWSRINQMVIVYEKYKIYIFTRKYAFLPL